MRKKLSDFGEKIRSKIPGTFKWRLPYFYGLGLIFGLVLVFISGRVPSLNVCSRLFGEEFCTPAGVYLVLILSLPGYFVLGNLFPFLENANWILSLVLVLLTSAAFYFLLGILLDKFKKEPYEKKILILVLTFFFVLLLALLLFLL